MFKVGDRVAIKDGVSWNHGENNRKWNGAEIVRCPAAGGKYYDVRGNHGGLGLVSIDEIQPFDPAPQPPTPEQRAMSLVKEISRSMIPGTDAWFKEARAICAEMEPVSPDVLAARDALAKWQSDPDGNLCDHFAAAIAKGRALEKGEA